MIEPYKGDFVELASFVMPDLQGNKLKVWLKLTKMPE